MELLDASDVPLEGAEAVVVGRSNLVGKPMAQLLLARHATVTICHSRTRDLRRGVPPRRRADRGGRAPADGRGDWVKPGAAVIDVGMNRTDAGLLGDVDFDAVGRGRRAITPVPGGVGPMTIAMLLGNTLEAAARRRASPERRLRHRGMAASPAACVCPASPALFLDWYGRPDRRLAGARGDRRRPAPCWSTRARWPCFAAAGGPPDSRPCRVALSVLTPLAGRRSPPCSSPRA